MNKYIKYLYIYTKYMTKYINKIINLDLYKKMHNNSRITLKAMMPYTEGFVPLFIAATALTDLNQAVVSIDHTLSFIDNAANNINGQEQLERLQGCFESFNTLVKDQCALANAKIAHYNDRRFHYDPEYHEIYRQSQEFYNSDIFRNDVNRIFKELKTRIVDLTKNGYVTADSYNADGSIKMTVTSYKELYKQAFRR